MKMRERERERARDATTIVYINMREIFLCSVSGQHSNATINEKLINLINASKEKFINLVGDSLSLLLFGPLSCVLKLRWNKSLARDRVLTSGDFSECSDSEFSCSELTDRPL